MKNNSRRLIPWLLSAALTALPATASAQGYDGYTTPMRGAQYLPYQPAQEDGLPPTASYGEKIGHKAASGFANLGTSWLEIPKNIINTHNQSNLAYGLVGGTIKGILNTTGRALVGAVDLITFWLPTKPIPNPPFVWQDFDADTTYGPIFRLRETAVAESKPALETPEPLPAVPPPAPGSELDSAAQRLEDAARETDRKLDAMFKKELMK